MIKIFWKKIKSETSLIVRTSGDIRDLRRASNETNQSKYDFVAIGRLFLKNPFWLLSYLKQQKKNKNFHYVGK